MPFSLRTDRLNQDEDLPLGGMPRVFGGGDGRFTPWLVPATYIGCLTAFVADMTSANTLAFGVFYAPLVVTAVFYRDPRAVWVLAAIACAMVVVGSFFPVIVADTYDLVGNRILSLCAVLATAMFVRHARIIQDRLTDQTRRAEAAERIKTEVLTNLSQEIRAPLHSLIGVLDLLALNGSADQKAALHLVRGSGRRLAATVDNLVDLTRIEDTSLPAEPTSLGMIVRQTLEAQRADALARQIGLACNPFPDTQVHANPWALRRILENLVADAILHTAPGGKVGIHVLLEKRHVHLTITDTGTRPPGVLHVVNALDVDRLTPSVMGLALSQRLARAMRARLMFSTGEEEGTMARLRLPLSEISEQKAAVSPKA